MLFARLARKSLWWVIAVVDRREGAAKFYRDKGIPFTALFTADEFLNAPA